MSVISNGGVYNAGTFIPFVCNIAAVENGLTTIVTTSVNHGFVVGNQVQFVIPQAYGMTQLDGLKAYVLSIGVDTIEVNINSLNFNEFITPVSYPLLIIQSAQVIPIGDSNYGYSYTGQSPSLQIPGAYINTYP